MNTQKFYQIVLITAIIILGNFTTINASEDDNLLSEAIRLSEDALVNFENNLYLKSHGICERILSAEPNNNLAKYYLAYNKYRIINMAMLSEDLKQFDLYYDSAIKVLESLEDVEEYKAEARTLLAAIFMMKLAIDQSDAQTLSMKVHSNLERAIRSDSTNPRSYLIKGTMLFNTPPMFGGSIDGAINNFSKAVHLFESQSENKGMIHWGYLETLAWKGMALTKKGDYINAKIEYEKALNIEPNYGWVKNKLLPGLENLSNEKETSLNDNLSTIKVLITGFRSNDGALMMKLNNSREEFVNNSSSFRSIKKEIIDGKVEYSFTDIPFGEYALRCYHDENNNGKLDSNSFGIPKESYGFSNNARGRFGPPSFEEAKFDVDTKIVSIKINVN